MKMEVLRSEVMTLSLHIFRLAVQYRKNPSRGATRFLTSEATIKIEVLCAEGKHITQARTDLSPNHHRALLVVRPNFQGAKRL